MFDSIVNVNDFLSEHWLAEVFPARLKDLVKRWKEDDEHDKPTPVGGLLAVATRYLAALTAHAERGRDTAEGSNDRALTDAHGDLLRAMGIPAVEREERLLRLETCQGETPIVVPLLARVLGTSSDALHVLQAYPIQALDELFAEDSALVNPIEVRRSSEKTEFVGSVAKALTQTFLTENAPRYALVLAGGWVLLTDAERWSEGRYLAFDVRTALDRRDDKATGELAWHAGLWSADVLLPGGEAGSLLDDFTSDSVKHAVGVSEDLREGLRTSIELIANEVIARRREAGQPVEGIEELPAELTSQALRFLYRILFLLFAEARPELGILPVGAPEYGAGYGLDRLRELVQVPLTGPSLSGHHLHDSLALLFRLVNDGYGTDAPVTDEHADTDSTPTRPEHPGTALTGNKGTSKGDHEGDGHDQARRDARARARGGGDGLVFEALRADLFDPVRTPLIDSVKLSNGVLQEVLGLLLLSKPSKRRFSQRGFVSYAQLGINQLGAVYEGLMSYSGMIAAEDMVELAPGGNADKGSWLVPAWRGGDYDESDLVWREDRVSGEKHIVRHLKGTFVFRLSGRDRQRSASYYTPEVLTRMVVTSALQELLTDSTPAQEILEYRLCEPALGSGAFLNEAINQLARAYLERRQREVNATIPAEEYAAELQKVKAHLALHRAYGVDLNATAVELAEVSLWLNVMHRGLQAPWFGLHLRRGNSLIGARRATYDFTALGRAKKSWLSTPPTERPLAAGAVPAGEIHHFLVPSEGWGAVAGAKQAKELAPERVVALKQWQKAIRLRPSVKQLDRLKALSGRVERLWALSRERLEISEREVARRIDVWGSQASAVASVVTRREVEDALKDPDGPYERLRLAMDAWCALWFWPLDADSDPPTLEQWLSMLEGLLGAGGVPRKVRHLGPGQQGFDDVSGSFSELAQIETREREFCAMTSVPQLFVEHAWLGEMRRIAEQEGFFHWELDFAQVFGRGGFDLQVGNPPWVRPRWEDNVALASTIPTSCSRTKSPTRSSASGARWCSRSLARGESISRTSALLPGSPPTWARQSSTRSWQACRPTSTPTSWSAPGAVAGPTA